MQKTANVTLKTVAATAGCSIAVASTVLNGSRGNTKVSDAMRRRILELAAELGYHPNFASQSLKTRRSMTLGIYVQPKSWRSLSNDYEMAIFRGVEQAARGLALVLTEDREPDLPSPQQLRHAKGDAVRSRRKRRDHGRMSGTVIDIAVHTLILRPAIHIEHQT